MATIHEAKLTHEERHPRVLFTVKATVEFEEQELNHDWLFEITLAEHDVVGDDRLKRERYYFAPDETEMDLTRQIDMGWAQVDTEPGKEEVYAEVFLAPLDAPPNMTSDRTRSNMVNVDV
ncbi:MAG: hypothetical protein ACOC83_08815 [Gemmatimonadota bacterium]